MIYLGAVHQGCPQSGEGLSINKMEFFFRCRRPNSLLRKIYDFLKIMMFPQDSWQGVGLRQCGQFATTREESSFGDFVRTSLMDGPAP